MSLGKLLATGRSLAGGPTLGRYNVSECNRLPKFGSAKNPFAQSAAKSAVEAPAATAPTPSPAASTVSPTSAPATLEPNASSPFSAAQAHKRTQIIPPLSQPTWMQRANRAKAAIVALGKRAWVMAPTGAAKLWDFTRNLLGRMKRVRRREPQSVIPRFGKPAIQGELSLDNVKVIRNDLEESDLEIVTAQTGTSTQVAPSVAPMTPNRGPLPPALKKLTNRMLGVKLS
jgi:hypothetical protein